MAPSCIFQLPGAGQAEVHRIADLVRGLPCYRLSLGTDMAGIPRAIESIVREVGP